MSFFSYFLLVLWCIGFFGGLTKKFLKWREERLEKEWKDEGKVIERHKREKYKERHMNPNGAPGMNPVPSKPSSKPTSRVRLSTNPQP